MKHIYRHIIIISAIAAAVTSCSTAELQSPAEGMTGAIMVKPRLPEMSVETKAELTAPVYAYIPEELTAGSVSPISASLSRNDIYYYNIPEECTTVLFSNVKGTESESVQIVSDGTTTSFQLKDPSSASMASDILFGHISEVTAGNTEAYDVLLNRMSSQISSKFEVTDYQGNPMSDSSIESITVTYAGFATELVMNSDYTFTPSGNASLTQVVSLNEGDGSSDTANIIPGADVNTCTVTMNKTDGTSSTFETSLDRVLSANRSYEITFRLKKANGSVSFTLDEPDIREYSWNIDSYDINKTDLFNVQKYWHLLSSAGANITIPLEPQIPYAWNFALVEGNEWFTAEWTEDGKISVTTLSENVSESRVGTIRLTAENGMYQDIYVSQMNASKQSISMVKANNSGSTNMYISGENIEIDYGNGFESIDSNGSLSFDGIGQGTTITIQADDISDFRTSSQLYSDITFNNCVNLVSAHLTSADETIDVSALPALKSVTFYTMESSAITFAEGQKVEEVILEGCDQITQISFPSIGNSLKRLEIKNCSNLTTFQVYPASYTGEKRIEEIILEDNYYLQGVSLYQHTGLKRISVMNSRYLASLNLNGCTSLESVKLDNLQSLTYINFTNCSSLKKFYVESCFNVNPFLTDGADAIEEAEFNNCSISSLDLSDRANLKKLIIRSSVHLDNLNLSNCTALENIQYDNDSYYIYTKSCDISGCTSLKNIKVYFEDSSVNQNLKLENTALEDLDVQYLCLPYDFSVVPDLKKLKLNYVVGAGDLDLTPCSSLTDLYYAQYTEGPTSFTFPQSIETVTFTGSYDTHLASPMDFTMYPSIKELTLGTFMVDAINVAGMPELAKLSVKRCNNLLTIDANGCAKLTECEIMNNEALETLIFDNCTSLAHINQNVSAVSLDVLKDVSLTGCSALESVNFYESGLESLDFTDCLLLNTVDIRRNEMTAEGLNSTFSTLPDRNMYSTMGSIRIYDNPGASECDTNIAALKYWSVNTNY